MRSRVHSAPNSDSPALALAQRSQRVQRVKIMALSHRRALSLRRRFSHAAIIDRWPRCFFRIVTMVDKCNRRTDSGYHRPACLVARRNDTRETPTEHRRRVTELYALTNMHAKLDMYLTRRTVWIPCTCNARGISDADTHHPAARASARGLVLWLLCAGARATRSDWRPLALPRPPFHHCACDERE